MGGLIRALILVTALVAVGVFLGSALSQWWDVPGVPAAAGSVRAVSAPGERVRVEVLNAGGRANMARVATGALRESGFDVVNFGNAAAFDRDSSVVLDRVGRLDWARAVADALGIRVVRRELDENLFLDVSVLLGETWELPMPVPEPQERAWWDLRRLLPPREQAEPGAAPGGTMADPTGPGER